MELFSRKDGVPCMGLILDEIVSRPLADIIPEQNELATYLGVVGGFEHGVVKRDIVVFRIVSMGMSGDWESRFICRFF